MASTWLLLLIWIACAFHASSTLFGEGLYTWNAVKRLNITWTKSKPKKLTGKKPSSILKDNQPVYVSFTTISPRVHQVHKTVMSILQGTIIPTHIYLFVSYEAYMLDKGIPHSMLSSELREIAASYPFTIVYTNNTGPYRKLLPLLKKKWKEDCIIITIDDEDKKGLNRYVEQLLRYHVITNRESVVGLKVRRIGVCEKYPFKVASYRNWFECNYGTQEMMLLPTGTGGVLYRPRFFHPIVFSPDLLSVTKTTDDLTFRLATLLNGVSVVVGCRDKIIGNRVKSTCPTTYTASSVLSTLSSVQRMVGVNESTGVPVEESEEEDEENPDEQHELDPQVEGRNATNGDGEYEDEEDDDNEGEEEEESKGPTEKSQEEREDTLSDAAGNGVEDEVEFLRARRQLQSLYGSFNFRAGNDRSWKGAIDKLWQLLPQYNVTGRFVDYILHERKGCFDWDRHYNNVDYADSVAYFQRLATPSPTQRPTSIRVTGEDGRTGKSGDRGEMYFRDDNSHRIYLRSRRMSASSSLESQGEEGGGEVSFVLQESHDPRNRLVASSGSDVKPSTGSDVVASFVKRPKSCGMILCESKQPIEVKKRASRRKRTGRRTRRRRRSKGNNLAN